MRILGIETSGDTSSVALLEDGEAVAENVFASHQTICQLLVTQILAVVDATTVQEANLDGIAVSIGPASFTVLRVGVTTAKSIAYCCHVPVVGISTPLAWAAEVENAELGTIMTVLQPARRGRLYLTTFQKTNELWPQQRGDTQVVDEEAAVGYISTLAQGNPLVAIGTAPLGTPVLREHLADYIEVASTATTDSPRASTVARLGADKLKTAPADSYFTLRPHYVLVSQAERMHGVDLGL